MVLIGSSFVVVSHAMAKDARRASTAPWRTGLKIGGGIAGVALVLAFMTGGPNCTESDPVSGACVEYDDGPDRPVTTKDKAETFAFVLTLIGLPAAAGFFDKSLRR